MARCWGITKKLNRCRGDGGSRWFCHIHEAQPRYFLVIAVSSIIFSYIAGILPLPWRSAEIASLTPGDFSMSLHVSAHANALPREYQEPERIALLARIGPVLLESRMDVQPEPAREYPSGRNPNRYWKYADQAPFVRDLPELTMRDLVGKTLTARIPVRAFRFKTGPTTFQLRVFVRGRELYAEADENGEVSLLLTKELLIGD